MICDDYDKPLFGLGTVPPKSIVLLQIMPKMETFFSRMASHTHSLIKDFAGLGRGSKVENCTIHQKRKKEDIL